VRVVYSPRAIRDLEHIAAYYRSVADPNIASVLGCENQLLDFHSPDARTLAGFTKIYAGNPPQRYIDAIVQAMGGDPNVQISMFLS
jgi:plasmid stabilization system protein ParE